MTNSLFPCGYTQNGEERIHRALQATECMADLLRHHADHPNKPLNSDGLAAIFECVRDQINSAVESSAFFAGGERHERN
ncbi:hypothetical protein [Brenneria tiliae]|uniref:hypothetical protein n=1 Tax=Brenneria tiliae TaxID=2914984 RepID=UPI002014B01C|nr:hypothetical protein [Brenneria tiliae]MCL2899517.1 hypothetical protein [Brenneria tiliae]MCL2903895.1 hypothetical protein [Brenneria tiliae]